MRPRRSVPASIFRIPSRPPADTLSGSSVPTLSSAMACGSQRAGRIHAALDVVDALRRADVLVTTLFHAPEVEAAAKRLGKPWIAVALRPDAMSDAARGQVR